MLYCLRFHVSTNSVHTNLLSETSPFLSAQMTVLSIFFQIFVVLGMYNFGYDSSTTIYLGKPWYCCLETGDLSRDWRELREGALLAACALTMIISIKIHPTNIMLIHTGTFYAQIVQISTWWGYAS